MASKNGLNVAETLLMYTYKFRADHRGDLCRQDDHFVNYKAAGVRAAPNRRAVM